MYSDRSLVTDVDPLTDKPSSSSTMPSLMAAMLDALDVAPGQRILEVGTGTGYNAALLSKLVGPGGSVLTTEANPSVASRARERLTASGITNVTVVDTDSAVADPSSADHTFDRLIATVG